MLCQYRRGVSNTGLGRGGGLKRCKGETLQISCFFFTMRQAVHEGVDLPGWKRATFSPVARTRLKLCRV